MYKFVIPAQINNILSRFEMGWGGLETEETVSKREAGRFEMFKLGK